MTQLFPEMSADILKVFRLLDVEQKAYDLNPASQFEHPDHEEFSTDHFEYRRQCCEKLLKLDITTDLLREHEGLCQAAGVEPVLTVGEFVATQIAVSKVA